VYHKNPHVTQRESADLQLPYPECCTQHVADDIDCDVCTLDCKETLLAMGIICIGYFNVNMSQSETVDMPVSRLKPEKAVALAKINSTFIVMSVATWAHVWH
jgi:hypothetical protein